MEYLFILLHDSLDKLSGLGLLGLFHIENALQLVLLEVVKWFIRAFQPRHALNLFVLGGAVHNVLPFHFRHHQLINVLPVIVSALLVVNRAFKLLVVLFGPVLSGHFLRDQDWVTVWVLQEFREVYNVFVKNWLLGEELLQVVLD